MSTPSGCCEPARLPARSLHRAERLDPTRRILYHPDPMTIALFLAYVGVIAAGFGLKLLNLRHLRAHGHEVPPGFEGAVDAAALAKTSDYTLEKSRAGLVESLVDSGVLLLFIFSGGLGIYDRWVSSAVASPVWSGALFFVVLSAAKTAIGIPFDLRDTFRVEARYGFNTTTPGLWVADLLKSLMIASVLLGLVVAGALALVGWSPSSWWLWVWGFFMGVSVCLMLASPYVIEPLFFRFKPVAEESLETGIRALMERAGLKVSRVFEVDASRRSKHSNAYFTGIGKVKRVVLFDTLLKQMTPAEVLAVLAHEVGHWKRRHVLKRLSLTSAVALAALYLAFRLVSWGGLPGLVGLSSATLPAQAVILSLLVTVAGFLVTPLFAWLSRRDEREADRFACDLSGDPASLASALVKLSTENLSNLHPHPLYAGFYHSHPPAVERVGALRRLAPPARA